MPHGDKLGGKGKIVVRRKHPPITLNAVPNLNSQLGTAVQRWALTMRKAIQPQYKRVRRSGRK